MGDGFKAKPVSDEVIHILETEPNFKVGDTVHGKIDWERRYKIMKLHTAAHITYFVAVDILGVTEIKGSYVDNKKDRFDFVYDGRIEPEKIQEIAEKANEIIAKNQDIQRTEDSNNPGIWVWKTEGMPEMNCGGTHVKNTKEIGRIRCKRKNPGAGLERVETYLEE